MPTTNAPRIGESPITAATPAAPKNAAVTTPSILPPAFHSLELTSFGTKNMAATAMAAKNASTLMIVNDTSTTAMDSPPTPSDVTTDKTAIAKMSSTTAAPIMRRASGLFSFPYSLSTCTEIAMLVAVRAVATSIA